VGTLAPRKLYADAAVGQAGGSALESCWASGAGLSRRTPCRAKLAGRFKKQERGDRAARWRRCPRAGWDEPTSAAGPELARGKDEVPRAVGPRGAPDSSARAGLHDLVVTHGTRLAHDCRRDWDAGRRQIASQRRAEKTLVPAEPKR